MSKEYYSCEFIEGGIMINFDRQIYPCCVDNIKDGRSFWILGKMADFDESGDFSIDDILAWREKARAENQREGFPICKGCVNLRKTEWESPYLFDRIILAHFPKCNVHCLYCNVPELDLPPEVDLHPKFESMIEKGYISPDATVFWAGGEPTISRNFEKLFNLFVHHTEARLYMDTNAVVFSNAIKQGLLTGRVEITCSPDSGTAETYKLIKRRDFHDRVWANLEEYAKTGGKVNAKMIVLEENCHEIVKFLDMVECVGIKRVFYDADHKEYSKTDDVINGIAALICEGQRRGIQLSPGNAVTTFGDQFQRRIVNAVKSNELVSLQETTSEGQNCYLVEIRNVGKSNLSLGEQIRILNVSSEIIPLRDLKNTSITKEGNWAIEEDFSAFLGQAIVSHARGDKIAFKMAGQRLKIDFACTQFGGKAEIRINDNLLVKTVDFFSPEWRVLPVSIKMGYGRERLLLKEDQREHKDQQLQKQEFGGTGHLTYEEPSHLSSIFLAPAEQLLPERLLLYSLVFGLRPKHCLEIGTHWGGSAVIICAAMDDVGSGHLVCIDPNSQIAPEIWEHLKHRTDLVQGSSPDALPQALELSASFFDFALIDGDHTYNSVLKDIEGVIPCLADRAYLLFHDCHYFEIEDAINEALRRYPSQLHDCGILSVEAAPENMEVNGQPVLWGGLRLLLFTRARKQIEPQQKQLQAIQEELRVAKSSLQAIEKSLTWQIGQKLARSWPGRVLHYLISHFRT